MQKRMQTQQMTQQKRKQKNNLIDAKICRRRDRSFFVISLRLDRGVKVYEFSRVFLPVSPTAYIRDRPLRNGMHSFKHVLIFCAICIKMEIKASFSKSEKEVGRNVANVERFAKESATAERMKHVVVSSTIATGLFLSTPLVTEVEAALGDQPLKKGMSHPDVKELQEALKAKGYFNYPTATGYYGEITEKAVATFQKAVGLSSTGEATLETIERLIAFGKSGAPTNVVLRQGMTSPLVTALQLQLKEAGYFKQEPTGYYGRATTQAVRAFQKANGLKVDGIAGKQTLTALQNYNGRSLPLAAAATTPTVQQQKAQPTLRYGARGDAVITLQQKLRDLGFYTGSVDGIFGRQTEEAVRKLQEQHGLIADGIVGAKTWRALDEASPSQPQNGRAAEQMPNTPARTLLKIGDTGEDVKMLQAQLKAIGLFAQEPTGTYGAITEQAVRAFQRQYGLAVDGIAGPKTLAKLKQVAGTPVSKSSHDFHVMHLIADASELIGVPYQWGGIDKNGFDCSGFIYHVFAKNGIQVARTVAGMWEMGKLVDKPAVGDLVFFETYASGPTHAGIYIGNDQFIHSGASTGVTIANMNAKYWRDRYLGAKRLY